MEKLRFLQDLPLTFSKDEVTVKGYSDLSYHKKKKKKCPDYGFIYKAD